MQYYNAVYKNLTNDEGNVLQRFQKNSTLIQPNDGTRSYTVRTAPAYQVETPFHELQDTRLLLTHTDHDISQIEDGFITLKIQATFQLSETPTVSVLADVGSAYTYTCSFDNVTDVSDHYERIYLYLTLDGGYEVHLGFDFYYGEFFGWYYRDRTTYSTGTFDDVSGSVDTSKSPPEFSMTFTPLTHAVTGISSELSKYSTEPLSQALTLSLETATVSSKQITCSFKANSSLSGYSGYVVLSISCDGSRSDGRTRPIKVTFDSSGQCSAAAYATSRYASGFLNSFTGSITDDTITLDITLDSTIRKIYSWF